MAEDQTTRNKHKLYAIKIAAFNALGYCIATGVATYIDPKLTSHRMYGARPLYPLGFWILLVGPVVFGTNYWVLSRTSSIKQKTFLPAVLLLVITALSLPNFRPEWFHMGVVGWTFLFALTSVACSWIHYLPLTRTNLSKLEAKSDAKIAWVKETISLWRTVFISLTGAYLALLIPWFNYFLQSIPQLIPDENEARLLRCLLGGQLSIFSLFVFSGPLFEAMQKAREATDLLLEIRD